MGYNISWDSIFQPSIFANLDKNYKTFLTPTSLNQQASTELNHRINLLSPINKG